MVKSGQEYILSATFPIQGLKQGVALSPIFFKFAVD